MDLKDNLAGWYPINITKEFEPRVIWANLEEKRFTKPFFQDELSCIPHSTYRSLSLESLTYCDDNISLAPSAFIFHVSRCGSTLMTQQLMQLNRCLVMSEPPILESVLSYGRKRLTEANLVQLLRSTIGILGRRVCSDQSHFIIKLDCWHLAYLTLIQKAFPETPCFLLYRQPGKVFASHQKQPGVQMIPGLVDTRALPIDSSSIPIADLNSYQLEVLRGLFVSALEHGSKDCLKLINYQQLPGITGQAFAQAIQLDLSEQERVAMSQRARQHSKNTFSTFQREKEACFPVSYQARLDQLTHLYNKLDVLRNQQIWTAVFTQPIQQKEFVMTDAYHKLPMNFDVVRLKQDLDKLQNRDWLEHINKGVHDGGWSALPLRSVDGKASNAVVVEMDPERYQSTPYLKQSEYLQEVLASFDCTLVSARLMSLKAGQEIRRHTDMDLCFEDGCVRLHIPIQTHQDVTFLINDQPIHFGEGECWYMNANYPHQVTNNSELDRVHLVIDCLVNDWLKELFVNAGYEKTVVEHKYGSPGITDDNVLEVIKQFRQMGGGTALQMADDLESKWQKYQKELPV